MIFKNFINVKCVKYLGEKMRKKCDSLFYIEIAKIS